MEKKNSFSLIVLGSVNFFAYLFFYLCKTYLEKKLSRLSHSQFYLHLCGCIMPVSSVASIFPFTTLFSPILLLLILVLFASFYRKNLHLTSDSSLAFFFFFDGNQFPNHCSVIKLCGSLCLNLQGGGMVLDCAERKSALFCSRFILQGKLKRWEDLHLKSRATK